MKNKIFKEIKLYKASSFSYTPFGNFDKMDEKFLNDNGIYFTKNPKESDIIISQQYKKLKKHFWRFLFGKSFLIWTLEPRFDTNFVSVKPILLGLSKIHIMNIYTKDVFVSNLSFHAKLINKKLNLLPNDFKLKSRQIVALMSYYKGIDAPVLIKNRKNIDLIALRSRIALRGSELGLLDVFGKGWPEGISKEDSREGDWPTRKKVLLSNYHFNLCFENTSVYNYMTEKIWDSIENYCLPIYFGDETNVYDLFPENSFIDYSKFKSELELFDFIKNISDKEFVERINKCIHVYNNISEKHLEIYNSERKIVLEKIVEKIKEIQK